MKKWIAMLLASLMLLTVGSALAGVEVDALRQVVRACLDENQLYYEYDEENEWFELTFELDSILNTVDTTIFLYDDMVSVSVEPPIEIPEDQVEDMAIFLTLANDDLYYAQFRMDMENQYMSCRSCNVIETVLPGTEEIFTLLAAPLNCMESYGDAIMAVINENVDPYTAIREYVKE